VKLPCRAYKDVYVATRT